MRQAAEGIVQHLKTAFAPYTILRVDEKAFSHLDLERYRQFQEAMEAAGYRFLSDLEIVEINKSPNTVLVPTMIRSMVSADGETSVGYYQARHKIQWIVVNFLAGILMLRFLWAPTKFLNSLRTMHCYDFTSEVGGTFIGTSNASDAAAMSVPASVDVKFFDYATSVTDVRTAHEARLSAAVRRAGTSVRPTKMSSHEDVRAMQARLKRAKDDHRVASGWITEKEIQNMVGNALFARAIYAEVQKILAETPIVPADA
jgi:hypothetical protein